MALGLGALGLPPHAFWSMTPRELDAALRGRFGNQGAAAAPSRHDLSMLMDRYPDRKPIEVSDA